jgi:hypothetical protein
MTVNFLSQNLGHSRDSWISNKACGNLFPVLGFDASHPAYPKSSSSEKNHSTRMGFAVRARALLLRNRDRHFTLGIVASKTQDWIRSDRSSLSRTSHCVPLMSRCNAALRSGSRRAQKEINSIAVLVYWRDTDISITTGSDWRYPQGRRQSFADAKFSFAICANDGRCWQNYVGIITACA